MNMLDWAKKEVELACRKEDGYGAACCESALKAFNCLMEDGHSGMSIQITKDILNRLIDGKPLMPITDADFEGITGLYNSDDYLNKHNLIDDIQCPRMSSLFKEIYKDGTIKYQDINRIVCRNKYNPNNTYSSGKGRRFVDNLFPITLPYMPKNKPYYVITDECLIDPKVGDWDTEAWYEIITPEGEHIPINYFCKYVGSDETEVEITEEEFNERKNTAKFLSGLN